MIVFATHPKSGTAMCREIFETYAQEFSLKFYNTDDDRDRLLTEDFDIVHYESVDNKNIELLQTENFKGIHVLRDPRDQLISATFYYRNLPPEEYILFKQLHEFDYNSYADMIEKCETFTQQLDCTLKLMLVTSFVDQIEWDYSDTRYLTVKYEDLVDPDKYLSTWKNCIDFLQIEHADWMLNFIKSTSINNKNRKKSSHIRNGRPNQWQEYLSKEQLDKFEPILKLGVWE